MYDASVIPGLAPGVSDHRDRLTDPGREPGVNGTRS
jgi:hypothetical protein